MNTAVLFCDLDDFKRVNDRLGHRSGDELLRQVAFRLRDQIGSRGTIGRLSGDEFAILIGDLARPDEAVEAAGRVVDSRNSPFHLAGQDIRISASVGVAVHEGQGGRGEEPLDAADGAMYSAKRTGRNQVAVVGHASTGAPDASLQAELSTALAGNEMRLFFQPVVDIFGSDGGTVVGAEALIRWEHPRLGLLTPAAFLPLAQETGLIAALDLWVIGAACSALASWPAPDGEAPAGPELSVAVNLDAATFLDRNLVPSIREALNRNRLAPGRLILEVVESRALVDLPGIVERLVDLRRLGIRVSLDDFGTG